MGALRRALQPLRPGFPDCALLTSAPLVHSAPQLPSRVFSRSRCGQRHRPGRQHAPGRRRGRRGCLRPGRGGGTGDCAAAGQAGERGRGTPRNPHCLPGRRVGGWGCQVPAGTSAGELGPPPASVLRSLSTTTPSSGSWDFIGCHPPIPQACFARPPSVVVSCAGITRDEFLLHLSEDDWDRVLAVNLKVVTSGSVIALIALGPWRGSLPAKPAPPLSPPPRASI